MKHPNAQQRIDLHLQEGKQVGTLYHWTDMRGCIGILESDAIWSKGGPSRGGAVSFTRDKDTSFWGDDLMWRFRVDGDKISQRFKIGPYADTDTGFSRQSGRPEAEEQVVLPKGAQIKPLRRYVIALEWHGRDLDLEGAAEIAEAADDAGGVYNLSREERGWDYDLIDSAVDIARCLDLAKETGVRVEDHH